MDHVRQRLLNPQPLRLVVSGTTGPKLYRQQLRSIPTKAVASNRNYENINISGNATVVVGDVVQHHSSRIDPAQARLPQARQRLIESLTYLEMNQRISDIAEEYEGTFEWVFDDFISSSCDSLGEWLRGDEGVFWIHGKAGSGKSTLMKRIWTHEKTRTYLWCTSRPDPCILKHSFWLPGTSMQKNYKGLLCSLLKQLILDIEPMLDALIIQHHYLTLKTIILDWSLEELSRFLQALLRERAESGVVCLFLDGLDEIEAAEDRESLLDHIGVLLTIPDVKLCLSSRFESPWINELQSWPSFRLQDLTRADISDYVQARLRKAWFRDARSRVPNEQYEDIVKSIVSRAEGVFLWARLAVTSLLNTTSGASWGELAERVDALPAGIAELYEDMLRRRNDTASVVEEAASYLKLCLDPWGFRRRRIQNFNYGYEPGIHVCLVLRDRCFEQKARGQRVIDNQELRLVCKRLRTRIRDICGGMISFTNRSAENSEFPRVSLKFHHRSVLDFLTDNVAGKTLLQKTSITEGDVLLSHIEAEAMLIRQSNQGADSAMLKGCLGFMGQLQSYHTTLDETSIALAIQGLESIFLQVLSQATPTATEDVNYLRRSQQTFTDMARLGFGAEPSLDIAGFSLQQCIACFFNSNLAQYAEMSGSNGRRFTQPYKDYLLACAIEGDLPEVALRLVQMGADIHGRCYECSGKRRIRHASTSLLHFLTGPRENLDWAKYKYNRRDETRGAALHRWRFVLAEHHPRSCFTLLRCGRDGSYLVQEERDDWTETSAIFVVLDIGRCCSVVRNDILDRGPSQEATRFPWEICPSEYAGFAIVPYRQHVVPFTMETLQLLPCRKLESKWGPGGPDIDLSFDKRLLSYNGWTKDWYSGAEKALEEPHSSRSSQASTSGVPEASRPKLVSESLSEAGTEDSAQIAPEVAESVVMFWAHCKSLGLAYGSSDDGEMQDPGSRFESVL